MNDLHRLFQGIKALQQERGHVDHPTTLSHIKRNFVLLPEEDRADFIAWIATHRNAHLIHLLEEAEAAIDAREATLAPLRLKRLYSYISISKPK